ncbi:MAG: nucleoside deaminase [Desulfosarcina sp.]|nr:nucleoside deaminase [Desulfosarcina sp.]MDX2451673.1 nucleoside deaminase [Desulfosarcina sp.]MDX2489463.1 nucleoside deaminase [Desulfosarcina sp.]
MTAALDLAQTALADGEFPVGCVIANSDTVVARGQRTGTAAGSGNEIDHAEINALRRLCGTGPHLDRSKLTIYCTMEPCLMCFSAVVLSGIGRIVYAYEDVMGGGTECDRSAWPPLYRDAQLTVIAGVLRANSLVLFQRFFTDSGNPYWADSLLSRYTLDQPVSA